MRLRSLNNATVLIKSKDSNLLIDPWIVGKIYKGAWSPIVKMKNLNFLNKVTDIFISHIHQDHWDEETLKLLNRDVKIFIPNMIVNNVIKKNLINLGFKNIEFKNFDEIWNVGQNLELKIIPPMNTFGQRFEDYIEGYESSYDAIDTSLFVKDKLTNTAHLFLCDNTPYDQNILSKHVQKNLTSLWYPFNSYAQDYPICYELSSEEKITILDEMHNKRKETIKSALRLLKPKYYFPHSADFILNGPNRFEFEKYVKKEFMQRELVAKNYNFKEIQDLNCISSYLNISDELEFLNEDKIFITRKKWDVEPIMSINQLEEFQSDIFEDLPKVVKKSFSLMIERTNKYKIDMTDAKNWVLSLKVNQNSYNFSFSLNELIDTKDIKNTNKIIIIKLTEKQLSALLNREFHWNNAMGGFYLNTKRVPDEYCGCLYRAINYLHL